jgi:hypothetical protein
LTKRLQLPQQKKFHSTHSKDLLDKLLVGVNLYDLFMSVKEQSSEPPITGSLQEKFQKVFGPAKLA